MLLHEWFGDLENWKKWNLPWNACTAIHLSLRHRQCINHLTSAIKSQSTIRKPWKVFSRKSFENFWEFSISKVPKMFKNDQCRDKNKEYFIQFFYLIHLNWKNLIFWHFSKRKQRQSQKEELVLTQYSWCMVRPLAVKYFNLNLKYILTPLQITGKCHLITTNQ